MAWCLGKFRTRVTMCVTTECGNHNKHCASTLFYNESIFRSLVNSIQTTTVVRVRISATFAGLFSTRMGKSLVFWLAGSNSDTLRRVVLSTATREEYDHQRSFSAKKFLSTGVLCGNSYFWGCFPRARIVIHVKSALPWHCSSYLTTQGASAYLFWRFSIIGNVMRPHL